MIDHQAALIYTMVLVSAADRNMSDGELRIIGDNVRDLPAFAGYDHGKLTETLGECAALLAGENGLEEILKKIKSRCPVGCVRPPMPWLVTSPRPTARRARKSCASSSSSAIVSRSTA